MQRKRKVVIVVPTQDNDDDIKQRVKQRIGFVTYHDIYHAYKRNICKQVVVHYKRELVDSLCRDGTDTPIVHVHMKAF